MTEDGELDSAWIPGLVPDYLDVLPIDPRRSTLANKQYLYLSDGENYKLIAHAAEDAASNAKQRPEMNDPRRMGYAYGIWTPGAVEW